MIFSVILRFSETLACRKPKRVTARHSLTFTGSCREATDPRDRSWIVSPNVSTTMAKFFDINLTQGHGKIKASALSRHSKHDEHAPLIPAVSRNPKRVAVIGAGPAGYVVVVRCWKTWAQPNEKLADLRCSRRFTSRGIMQLLLSSTLVLEEYLQRLTMEHCWRPPTLPFLFPASVMVGKMSRPCGLQVRTVCDWETSEKCLNESDWLILV